MLSEPSIADRVSLVGRVLASVDFDDQSLLSAHEVDDIRSDRLLTYEFVAAQAGRKRGEVARAAPPRRYFDHDER